MDSLNQNDEPDQNDEDCFSDAFDEFQFEDSGVSDQSTSDSTICEPSTEIPSSFTVTTTLRRRRGSSGSNPTASSINLDISQINDSKAKFYKERKRHKSCRYSNKNEKNLDAAESTREVNSDSRVDSSGAGDQVRESTNSLEFLIELLIKAIGFQFTLFVNFITFPIWGLYSSYAFVIDPFGAIRSFRGFIIQKLVSLWNLAVGFLSPSIIDWLKEQKSVWNFLLKFGCGMFWASYACVILCGLLVSSAMFSGVLMRCLVESPVEIREELNFDYTQNSPVAFVPIMSCRGVDGYDVECDKKGLGTRVIPINHKLQANVLLTLPESGYNRNLGMFQIRVDFLSADGKVLASKRHPCMLKFKSEPIRILLTMFKVAPLITGYMSESQTVKVKIRGFIGDMPTSCLKVTMEQRAEYRPGAGIPEIYDASIILESELPVFKRLIWSWKTTIFVWISMTIFIIQLLFTLICCQPIIFPRIRPREVPAVSNSLQTSSQS